MNIATRVALLAACLVSSGYSGQPSTSGTPKSNPGSGATTQPETQNRAWGHVQALSKPDPVTKRDPASSKGPSTGEIKERIDRSRLAAAAAREFYLSYPADFRAAAARKIEVVATLRGTEVPDEGQVQSALSLAAAYRANHNNALGDRFEVALAMDRLELSAKAKRGLARGDTGDRLLIADNLLAEFREVPAVYDYYMEIARTADMATAVPIATRVSRVQKVSKSAKARADEILRRGALVGKKLNMKLTDLSGREINLGKANDKVTAVIVWRSADSRVLTDLLPSSALHDVSIVFVAIGGTAETVTEAARHALVKATHCHVPSGAESRHVIERLNLQYALLPEIFIINSAGDVFGSGSLSTLPELLARARVNG